jgi:hypothetical protein
MEHLLNGLRSNQGAGRHLDEARRAELRRDFIAFHDGFPTELGICVPREYLLTSGTRR